MSDKKDKCVRVDCTAHIKDRKLKTNKCCKLYDDIVAQQTPHHVGPACLFFTATPTESITVERRERLDLIELFYDSMCEEHTETNKHNRELQAKIKQLEADRVLLEGLMHTISTVHLDMGGNHRYALSHKSNKIISEIKSYLSRQDQGDQAMSDKKGFDGCTCQRVRANCQHCQDMSDKPEKIWIDAFDDGFPISAFSEKVCCHEESKAVEYLRADLAKPSEWISVADRLPEDHELVLISVLGDVGKGFYDSDRWNSDTFDPFYTDSHITHWQPLPSPPGKE